MRTPNPIRLAAALLLLLPLSSQAMTRNLAEPYNPAYSRPRSQEVAWNFPARPDAIFTRPDECRFEVWAPATRLISGQWTLHHNLRPEPLASGSLRQSPDTRFHAELPLETLPPGFYDIRVRLEADGDTKLESFSTVGWKVGQIPASQPLPEGFAAFWQATAQRIRALPPDIQIERVATLKGEEIDTYNRTHAALPGNYDPTRARFDAVEVYKVHFASPNGGRVYGWFAKPVGPGPFPALLVLPGAGNNPRPAPVEHARHGWAALDVQIHGYPVDALFYPPPPAQKATSVEDHPGLPICRNALMAVGTLAALPGADPGRMAVCGGSQGGRLSIVVAALDDRIRATVAAITHYAALPWLTWSRNPKPSPPEQADATPTGWDAWFDAANFAPLIRTPVRMNAGLIDRVSPPTGIQKLFLRLAGEKELVYLPDLAHDWSPEFDRQAWDWLQEKVSRPEPHPQGGSTN